MINIFVWNIRVQVIRVANYKDESIQYLQCYIEPANEQIILWSIYMAYKTSIVVYVPFLTLYTLNVANSDTCHTQHSHMHSDHRHIPHTSKILS